MGVLKLELGQIIKQYRYDNNLTMREFADKCGLSNGYISMLERGKHPQSKRYLVPSMDTIKKLCAGMGISVQDLFSVMDVTDWIESGFDTEQDMLSADASYYADRELLDILEELRSREDMRMLFRLAKGASPDDVRRAAAIIEALRKQE